MIKLINILKVVNVNKKSVAILDIANLHVKENDFLVITGKSGSGKSTLLNVIGGFDKISSGSYLFDENVVKTEAKRLNLRKDHIGYVTQNYALINNESVKENILLSLGVSKKYKKFEKNLSSILEQLDMTKLLHMKVNKLSGGEKQRVAIARAIIKQPKVLLLDEPTGNLDEENSQHIMKLISDIHKTGTTVILVTHDNDYIGVGNGHIHLVDGKIVEHKV